MVFSVPEVVRHPGAEYFFESSVCHPDRSAAESKDIEVVSALSVSTGYLYTKGGWFFSDKIKVDNIPEKRQDLILLGIIFWAK